MKQDCHGTRGYVMIPEDVRNPGDKLQSLQGGVRIGMNTEKTTEKDNEYIFHHVLINGLEVRARYSRKAVDEIFLPLLETLTRLQKEKQRRVIALIAAPPACGKSTLLSFLERLAKEHEELCDVQVIGMDGFHRTQEDLASHTTVRDGEEIPLSRIKGSPETYDLKKMTDRLRLAASGVNCGWPLYDRRIHDPVDDAVTIDGDVVLLEGNYLLLNDPGWRDLRSYADYTVMILADADQLKERLIDRKAKGMASREEARKFVEFSDLKNIETCLTHFDGADLVLEMTGEGEFVRRNDIGPV